MRLFCGIGISDMYGVSRTKEYRLWTDMLTRSYDEKLHQRQPTYLDCETSSEFLVLSKFHNWCQNQIGFNQPTFELDKDLLNKGNKEYHPDKCVFIPKEINSALRTRKKMRGNLPIGVTLSQSGSFMAMMNLGSAKKYLGSFSTPEQAFQAYKHAKENHIKLLAEKYRDQIDPRAYEALLNYKVEITD
jgi:hypothetical protein